MSTLTIGEAARRAGIETSAIRYYERAGLLPPPARRSGRRLYMEDVLKRLSLIKATKSAGFTIEEIRVLTAAWEKQGRPPRDWRAFVTRKLSEIQTIIINARKAQEILNAALAARLPSAPQARIPHRLMWERRPSTP